MAKIFKDLLGIDARAIMNVTEFAEYLQVNGVLLACQFCPKTEQMPGGDSKNYESLHGDYATLYFKTSDYTCKSQKPLPKQGDWIYIEYHNLKKRYRVVKAEDELGVMCLELSTYRQNRTNNVYNHS